MWSSALTIVRKGDPERESGDGYGAFNATLRLLADHDTSEPAQAQASKPQAFRRGTMPAAIYSLAFSPPAVQPPLLLASTAHGSLHLFRLSEPSRHGAPARRRWPPVVRIVSLAEPDAVGLPAQVRMMFALCVV